MVERLTVELHKPGKHKVIRYHGTLLRQSETQLLLHARWRRQALELPPVTFLPGDHFFEHYFFDAPYTIFEVRAPDGRLKGWYCNVCRPARLEGERLVSEDLELDLVVSADRQTVLTLDEDEFRRRAFDQATVALARRGLAALRRLAASGRPPFDGSDAALSLGVSHPAREELLG